MIYFDEIEIKIGNSGLLCESVSIDSSNSLQPIYSIGKKGVKNIEPNGPISNKINLSYYLDLGREPIFNIINTIKNMTGEYLGETISVCNITGLKCYLDNYSLNSSPNSLVRVDASFVSFENLTGSLGARPTGIVPISDFSGRLAMGWTAHVVSGNSYLTAPVYSFDYSFSADWEPSYILGRKTPLQVDFVQGAERFSILKDTYKFINFTGQELASNSNLSPISTNELDSTVNLYGYTHISDNTITSPTISINVSGSKVQNSSFEISVDDFGRNLITSNLYYN